MTAAGSFLDSPLARWWDRRRGARTVVIAWLVTRLLIIGILLLRSFIVGDVFYYWRKINALFDVGLSATLNEYPTPVVWILTLPYAITGGNPTGYLVAFMIFMMVLDAGFTYAVWRAGDRIHDSAIDCWLLFVVLIGPLSYVRFDMIPAVLAGGALLAARRRPGLVGVLTGVGAAVKLWPALLIAAFAAHKPDRTRALIGFVVAGFGLAAVSLVAGGMTRLFSPLTWQSNRGLQIESIWATPLMVARAINPQGWRVDLSRYQAFEIFGPGVAVWLAVSSAATVAGLVAVVMLLIRAYRRPADAMTVGLLVLAVVTIMIVTNKTLSPQYLLWLGGPVAALLLLRRTPPADESRVITRVALQALMLAALTQLVYPFLYDGLIGLWGWVGITAATIVTALRNVALVIFTVEVCRYAWRMSGPWSYGATSSSPGTPSPAADAGKRGRPRAPGPP